jgi:hypothetical protein
VRGHPCELLYQMCTQRPGNVGGAAAKNLDAPDFQQLMRGEFNAAEVTCLKARLQAPAQCPAYCVRLLDDLLAHVMRELALVERLVRPSDRRGRLGGDTAIQG